MLNITLTPAHGYVMAAVGCTFLVHVRSRIPNCSFETKNQHISDEISFRHLPSANLLFFSPYRVAVNDSSASNLT